MSDNDDADLGASVEYLVDRVEKEGCVTVEVEDGRIIAFTADMLKRLWQDAEASPKKQAIVFIRKPAKASA